MNAPQTGILAPLPPLARYLSFALEPASDPRPALRRLAGMVDGERSVAGIGRALASALGAEIAGLRSFPSIAGRGLDLPVTPAALWLWLRGDDRGELVHRTRHVEDILSPAFRLDECADAFQHDGGRDLTGYVDGTENPTGDKAVAAAIVGPDRPELAGSSFVAVQRWVHDFARFARMSADDQDRMIGRRRADNQEIEDAPESAHVRRTAQERFTPEAFVLRRSMPWAERSSAGLMFVAFGASFDPFEAQLERMLGIGDGIVDALFAFTRPASGAYFWCPALRDGRLDLSPLGMERD